MNGGQSCDEAVFPTGAEAALPIAIGNRVYTFTFDVNELRRQDEADCAVAAARENEESTPFDSVLSQLGIA